MCVCLCVTQCVPALVMSDDFDSSSSVGCSNCRVCHFFCGCVGRRETVARCHGNKFRSGICCVQLPARLQESGQFVSHAGQNGGGCGHWLFCLNNFEFELNLNEI